MDRILHIVGKTSSEIFMLKYPRSLLNFCDFDLTYFAENAIAVCEDALRSGELDYDRVTDLRNSLKGAHPCIENNIRTVYDKIVVDCWIDYLCRRDNVGTNSLWNRFIGCTTSFEKVVFTRLCDYRYNKAINEWLNLVRVQDYARNKISYIFSGELNSAEEAAARRNYFDLMFSVTAREMGCKIEELGVTKVFSVGRVPSAPFMFPNISKDIVKNLLADFDYSDDYSNNDNYGGLSDQIAMDAFFHMKRGLAQEYSSYNISRSAMENSPLKVYLPCGLKAVADLEIDALIESGGWLARCKRCGRYFVRDAEYTEEYCSLFNPGSSKTCLEIYELEHPKSVISRELETAYREVIDIMYDRVGAETMSLHEYESWKTYIDALHDKVENKEIPIDELESFIRYSRSLDISRSNPVREVVKRESVAPERVVRPFIPERIDRNSLPKPEPEKEEEPEDDYIPRNTTKRSFFTSPTVERSREQAPVTHIIRGGEQPQQSSMGGEFVPFGEQKPSVYEQGQRIERRPERQRSESYEYRRPAYEPERSAESRPQSSHYEPIQHIERGASDVGAAFTPMSFDAPKPEPKQQQTVKRRAYDAEQQAVFDMFDRMFQQMEAEKAVDIPEFEPAPMAESKPEPTAQSAVTEPEPVYTAPVPEAEAAPEPPKPKVIRKNAAAMSAYGKMSGTPMKSAFEPFEQISRPEEELVNAPAAATQPFAEEEPFKDVGSIFDVLEQSEADMSDDALRSYSLVEETEAPKPEAAEPVADEPDIIGPEDIYEADEPAEAPVIEKPTAAQKPKRRAADKQTEPREYPERVTAENAPSGVWGEERHLFSAEEQVDELTMLKEKKRRTNKTQRLFDAIMREPEDNPNVRKKK